MRKLTLYTSTACVLALAALSLAVEAQAASTISITIGPDPVESITTQLGVAGTSAESKDSYFLKVKPAGGRGCAANPEADEGVYMIGPFTDDIEDPGSFAQSSNWTFQTAGTYLLCAWLQHNQEASAPTVVASTSSTASIRQPHLSLSVQVPPRVLVGHTFQIAMTMQAETRREAYEYLLPNTGRSCPANADAAQSAAGEIEIHSIVPLDVDGGPSTVTDNETLNVLGAYLACAYFEYPHSDSVPELVANAAFVVVKPTPPCVVPRLGSRHTLAAVQRRIGSAHCRVGRVTYVPSSRYARGLVIGLNPRPGTKLAARSAVAIEVSAGPPRHSRKHRHHRHGR